MRRVPIAQSSSGLCPYHYQLRTRMATTQSRSYKSNWRFLSWTMPPEKHCSTANSANTPTTSKHGIDCTPKNLGAFAKASESIQQREIVNVLTEQTHSNQYTFKIYLWTKKVTLSHPCCLQRTTHKIESKPYLNHNPRQHNHIPGRLWHQNRITGNSENLAQQFLL